MKRVYLKRVCCVASSNITERENRVLPLAIVVRGEGSFSVTKGAT